MQNNFHICDREIELLNMAVAGFPTFGTDNLLQRTGNFRHSQIERGGAQARFWHLIWGCSASSLRVGRRGAERTLLAHRRLIRRRI